MDHCADEAARAAGRRSISSECILVVGAVRVDCCGALMLPSSSFATVITAEAITFGPLVYRRRAMPEAVLVWDSCREERGMTDHVLGVDIGERRAAWRW